MHDEKNQSQLLRRGHPAVWSGAISVIYSEEVLLPPGCEITDLMMGVAPLTMQGTVTVDVGE